MRVGDVAIGELTWCLIRSGIYSTRAFVLVMVAMGLTSSWWTLLALPAALLIGLAMADGVDDMDAVLAGLPSSSR